MNATSSVRRPMSRDSYVKNSVLVESQNAAKKEGVYVRKNKQPDNTFANVVSNKEDVIDVDVANISKVKTLLYVSFMQNVLIFMAISLFVMYIMLKEMICSQADVILICILSPFQEVAIGGTLSLEGRTELCTLLKKNLDIFAWQPSDMTGVPRSIAEHRLNIREGYSPVRQKKRGQAPERAKAIQAEVQKLVEAGIMREVYYHDWLSNPVMVKKHDGSWRMCVDFTDLNKACPQDCYPLPEIDWKIESLCGYPFKCFLDAYKGYHQIQMAESAEEKTAFHTSQ
ncbi:hypothetical protein Tco_1227912 [Tanacetum coccineum]